MDGIFEILFERFSDGLILVEADTLTISMVNQMADVMLDETRESLKGKKLNEVLQGNSNPTEWLNTVKKTGQISFKGSTFEIHGAPILFNGTSLIQFTLKNITEELRQAQLQKELQRLATLGHMSSTLAHEINNPLTVIIGFAELIQTTEELSESATAGLEHIRKEANRAAHLVKEFLTLSRSKTAHYPININELIKEVSATQGILLTKNNVELALELEEGCGKIKGDPHQIKQILIILLTNGMHAIENNSEKRITIYARHKDNLVTIGVKDNGTGVPKDIQGKIMEPFFTTKENGKGTGLGLSVGQHIARLHGTTLNYRDNTPNGADFYFSLPTHTIPSLSTILN